MWLLIFYLNREIMVRIASIQAAYLTFQSNKPSAQRSIMLMIVPLLKYNLLWSITVFSQCCFLLQDLLMNADKLLRADRPCSCDLWLGLLAFHLALVQNPQDSLVIWTFSSILYHGTWNEAVASSDDLIYFVPEILPPSIAKLDELLLKETSRFASLVKSSVEVLTDSNVLQQSLAKYGPLSSSQCLMRAEINYELLKKGDLNETRFVLGKIIMDTMKGEPISEADKRMAEGENKVRLSSLFS
ncbi:hypothetical protein MA16_Dca006532 [Dendrobium catenatum]|uniref:Uncharacterized protein n=1 Tax=Dendrobium catenatum TaxID=906689 RepID=A0A2I0XGW2_9ASPA|nr:hypothetical protein MA16_Dca006532 [Dendrobium catenatum]